MRRREEIVSELGLNKIVQESIKRHPRFADKRVGFIDGAEWMQKTMIEKACEWITEHADIPYEGEFIDNSPVASDYIEWCKKRLEYAKEIAEAFRKAMQNE